MEAQVLQPLNALETQLTALIQNLNTTHTWATAPQLSQSLVEADNDLTTALTLLHRHQQNYARILNLRAESLALEEKLKSTIRQCVSLREEIGQIHPSILEDSEDEDDKEEDEDDDAQSSPVDYRTLLTFAARIGKHNAVAAREAEAESARLRAAAKRQISNSNGVQDTQTSTEETSAEIERIKNNVAFRHAQMGMAFPDAAGLRAGELGQLQLFRERQALASSGPDASEQIDQAVDREVERLVRESENIAEAVAEKDEDPNASVGALGLSPELTRQATQQSRDDRGGQSHSASGVGDSHSRSQHAQQQPPPPKRKLDLDFPSSDDDDDD